MAQTSCGFGDGSDPALGSQLLLSYGPTILVDIGFDQNYDPKVPGSVPTLPIRGEPALVDTGALECCIDSMLAAQLNLPIIDRRPISGAHGSQELNVHLAQIFIPALNHTIWGHFAGVHLVAGGQAHKALIGRTFLKSFKLHYDGTTGLVTISS